MPPSRRDPEGDGRPRTRKGKQGARLISRDVLEHFRRERIYVAIAEVAQEAGPEALTTMRIVDQGRMSRNTFYELFGDKAECLELACEFATDRLVTSIREANPGGGDWRGRLGGVIAALLRTTSAEPAIAELCLVHTPAISTQGTEHGSEPIIEALVEVIEDGEVAAGDSNPESAHRLGEFVAATILSIVVSRVRRGETGDLTRLQGELTELAARLWSEPAERVGAP